MSKNKSKNKQQNLPSVEHLKERIQDIEEWYLYQSMKNKDTKMIEHWTKVLNTYKSWIHIMENGQAFNVEVIKVDVVPKKRKRKAK